MRSRILLLVVVSAALMGAADLASAQSAYSYPWCSRQSAWKGSTTSCYFTSYQQCMTTISGIGGYCYQSPYYHGPTAYGQAPARSRHYRHH
jgi:Protein of unknown function (DUF3551)